MRLVVAVVLVAIPAWGQTPSVVNGRLESRTASQSVERDVTAIATGTTAPAWVGYAVPATGENHEVGCWEGYSRAGATRVGPLELEGPDSIFVLYRLAERRVQQIRVASSACPLDIGGLTLHWLTGVRPADSIDWLETLATADGPRRLTNSATMAIALHRDPRATERLIALARKETRADVRGSALFWVAQRARDKAVGAISQALDDPETDVRKQAVFALSLLPKDAGVPKMIELARSHRDPAVRRQAMFWLGQSRDPRALTFFEQILSR